MGLFDFLRPKAEEIDFDNLPRHIAVIMDGNGRWAQRKGLPRKSGHSVGAETFRTIATYCRDIGIKYLTVYAFSTENWKRPVDEIDTIMKLLEKYLYESIEDMEKNQVRLKFFGDTSVLSPQLRELISKTSDLSEGLRGCQVNICVNYGGRDEIIRAAARYAEEYKQGRAPVLSESAFESYLYSSGIPDPDLVIRPSGELRLSNFLLWQSAYSELYFTDKLWPDFDKAEINRAIAAYQTRNRRFGSV